MSDATPDQTQVQVAAPIVLPEYRKRFDNHKARSQDQIISNAILQMEALVNDQVKATVEHYVLTKTYLEPNLMGLYRIGKQFYQRTVQDSYRLVGLEHHLHRSRKNKLALGGLKLPKAIGDYYSFFKNSKGWPVVIQRNRKLIDRLKTKYLKLIKTNFDAIVPALDSGAFSPKQMISHIQKKLKLPAAQAATVFRTDSTNYFSQIQVNYYNNNEEIIGFMFDSIRDTARTSICKSRHGIVFRPKTKLLSDSTPALHYNCYSMDTELYTERGFIPFSEAKVSEKALTVNPDTLEMEWAFIEQKQERYHKGKMLHLSNPQKSLDMLVTPDHTLFYRRRVDHGSYASIDSKFTDVETFLRGGMNNFFLLMAKWQGHEPEFIDLNGYIMSIEHYCRFMGFWLSDGSLRQIGNSCYVQIAQIVGQEEMFQEMQSWNLPSLTRTQDKLHIYDTRIGAHLTQFGESANKYVPELIKQLSPRLIRLFLDAFNQCDGYIQPVSKKFKGVNDKEIIKFEPMKKYFTTSKRLADDLGELILKSGKACRYSLRNEKGKEVTFKNGTYRLNYDLFVINEINSETRRAKTHEWIDYEGMVYDVTVSKNHTLLTRRNGRVVWNSNCRSNLIPLVNMDYNRQMLKDPKRDPEIQKANFVPLMPGWKTGSK